MKTILRLLGFLRGFVPEMLLSVLVGIATVASGIGLMSTSAWLISSAALHPSIADLQVAIVGVRFFGISRAAFRYLERLVSHSVNFRLLSRLRVWFYRAVEPLAPAKLQDKRSGDLLGRAMGDIEILENFYVRAVAPVVTAFLVTVGISAFIGNFAPLPGFLLGCGLILGGAVIPLVVRLLARKAGRRMVEERAVYSAEWIDLIQGMPDLLIYGGAEKELSALREQNGRLAREQLHLARIQAGGSAVMTLLTGWTLVAVLAAAIPLVSDGKLDGVMLAVVAMATLASFEAVMPLPAAAGQLESCLQAARRLFALADEEPAAHEPETPREPGVVNRIEVRDLTFSYASSANPALQEVDLSLRQGEHKALVGMSGAGKTSLANLLLRFWDIPRGTIFFNDIDLVEIPSDAARRNFAVVAQSTYIFTTSLRQNLLLAAPGVSEEQLWSALEQARLADWARSLPDGLDTWLGDRGRQMSGGERQRLAIARALLLDAPFWILDEPTAHLDTITAGQILDTLLEVTRGKGSLWITHQLLRMPAMDEILVLEDGRVIERGQHAQLAGSGGRYAQFWEYQNQTLRELDAPGTISVVQTSVV